MSFEAYTFASARNIPDMICRATRCLVDIFYNEADVSGAWSRHRHRHISKRRDLLVQVILVGALGRVERHLDLIRVDDAARSVLVMGYLGVIFPTAS